MKDLLFLTQRIPYPPSKGDKVRSFNFLMHLSRMYRVHLGTLVDDSDDWVHISTVRGRCADAYFARLNPAAARIRSARGLASGTPLTLPYFFDRGLQKWVDNTLSTRPIERVLVFSSSMAQYVTGKLGPRTRGILDFVDVDSEKWASYVQTTRPPLRWIYAREARTLLRYERCQAGFFDASVFVSCAEAEKFRELCPERADRVAYVENGVDAAYFSPDRDYPSPYAVGEKPLVFTGAMDYRANVDAVRWFAREVFPAVYARDNKARFYVVGSKPASDVRALGSIEGVRVTGAVPDVRPYLAHASLVVVPLRTARGVQNKVLEALAMARPVLATSAAIEGISCRGSGLLIADSTSALTRCVLDVVANPPRQHTDGRECVLKNHDWSRNLGRLVEILEGDATESDKNFAAARSPQIA